MKTNMKTLCLTAFVFCLLSSPLWGQQWEGPDNTTGVIGRTGNVGIGTTTPGAKLDVSGGTVRITNKGEGTVLLNLSSERHWEFRQLGTGPGTHLELASVGGGGNKNFVINTTGNVGIGTTTPQTKLDVSGGTVRIANKGEGAVLLNLGSERHWEFRQLGTGPGTHLELASVGGGGNKNFVVNTTGNVGIGTTTPREKLDVVGTTRTSVLEITGGSDLAEPFEIVAKQLVKPGMVVAIDPANPKRLRLADRTYDRTVAGIVSGANGLTPGLMMAQKEQTAAGALPVALTGRVYTWADASNGPIQPGDLLTTSGRPGHAMKVTNFTRAQGAILGKAMTALGAGQGLVLVLVTLQ